MAPRASLVLAALVTLASCGEREPSPQPAAGPDTTSPVMVPFHGVEARVAPGDTAPVVFEVAAGNPLRLLESRPGWNRLATWDDRTGWVPESATMDLALWAHYQQALGGAPLSDLRPAYPLADGRWGVEAPPPSPGVVTTASLWLVGDTPFAGTLSGVENVASTCGAAYRMGILAEAPEAGAARADAARLARARLATTAAPLPTLVALGLAETAPAQGDVEAVRPLADSLAAAVRAAVTPAGSPAPARFAPAQWFALGEGAAWVTLAGEPGPGEPDAASWAAAVVVREGRPRLVVPPHPVSGLPPALRPVLALTTAGGPPTILVVLRAGADGLRVEAYVARENDYRRFYQGYAWGC